MSGETNWERWAEDMADANDVKAPKGQVAQYQMVLIFANIARSLAVIADHLDENRG